MKKNWTKYSIVAVLTLGMLLTAVSLAEGSEGIDLYSPEICDGELAVEPMTVEAPAGEAPMSAETPMEAEALAKPVPQSAVAPELVSMEATQAVTLTGKKASVQMYIGETLQIVVNEGETGIFTSKKTNLATVDAAGLVTALAKGKTGIEFKPDGGKKRTLNITIVDPYEPKGISIAQGKTVGINVGQSLQLGAALAPETAQTTLTWTSSKASVAPVDENGIVTGLKEGKAKITVKTANKKKAKITVVVSDPYKPSGVAIAQGSAITLNAGESVQLVAGLIPEGAISTLTWSGGKAKVATVDVNGVVTAVGKGKVTVTVTTGNGKKAKCKVTVNAPEAPKSPKKVTLNVKKATLNVGEGYQLVATLPANSVSDLTWSTSNAAVAVVDANGYVTVVGPGTATITVVTVNGKKASFKVTAKGERAPSTPSIPAERIELTKFKGAKFSKIRKELGISGYGDGNIAFWIFDESGTIDYADCFDIIHDPEGKYSIYGMYLGMRLSEAETLLKSKGWVLADYGIGSYAYAEWENAPYKSYESDFGYVQIFYNAAGTIIGLTTY